MKAIKMKTKQGHIHVNNYLSKVRYSFVNALNKQINIINNAYEECASNNNKILSFIDKLVNNYSKDYPNYHIEKNILNNANINLYLYVNKRTTEKVDKESIEKVILFFNYYSIIRGNPDINLLRYEIPKTIIEPNEYIRYICFLQSGKIAISFDKFIKIYNPQDYKCEQTFTGHKGIVYYISQLPNGTIISCSSDSSIKFWNENQPNCINSIENAHNNLIYQVVPLPYDRIASCGYEGNIKIWNSNEPFELIATFHHPGSDLHSILYLKDTQCLLSGCKTGKLGVYDLSIYQLDKVIDDVYCRSQNSLIELENKRVIAGGINWITVVNIITYQIESRFIDFRLESIYSLMALSSNYVMFGTGNHLVGIYDMQSNTITSIKENAHDNDDIFSMLRINNQFALTCSKQVKLWNFNSYKTD